MKLLADLLTAFRQRLAWNHDAQRPTIGLAVNVAAIGADEWLQVAPYGETPYWDEVRESGKLVRKKFTQVFAKDQADKMVSALNSERTKAGAHFRGLPVYIGHPDALPQRWPDDKRLGGVMDLEARGDGLYAKVAWNSDGVRNRDEGFYVYPSPAWLHSERVQMATGKIIPDVLRSIGLTNSPRIQDVTPWTNTDHPTDQDQPNHEMQITELAKKLGLPETATLAEIETKLAANAAIIAEVETIRQTATNTATSLTTVQGQVTVLTTERATAQSEAEKFRKLAINQQLDAAITDRRLTAAERPAWETKFATNFDATAEELKSKKPELPNQELTLPANLGDTTTPAGRRLALNTKVDELMRSGLSYDAAHAQLHALPEYAALIKAMSVTAAAA